MAVTTNVDSRDSELHHFATQSVHYQSSTNLKVDKEIIQALQTGYCDKNSSDSSHGNDDSTVCGAGCCRPAFIQPCARMRCFTAVHSVAALLMMSMGSYFISQITTLERQFGFSSTISGLLISCHDLGCLLTTLPFSYLARRVHIPRALAACAMLFGLSGLVCTVPFFATRSSLSVLRLALVELNSSKSDGNITWSLSAPLCIDDSLENPADDSYSVTNNESKWRDDCVEEKLKKTAAISEDWKGLAIVFLAAGMVLIGLAKSARQPLEILYIDDNACAHETPLYYGIITSVSILGPFLALPLGAVFSSIYITLEDTAMSPGHPRWVGAWWLGFLVFGIANIIVAVPLMFFPRRLRPQHHPAAIREEQEHVYSQGKQFEHDIKEFFRSVRRVALTPVYMLVNLGSCCLVMGISGLSSFFPKYIEAQFFVAPWQPVSLCLAISLPIVLGMLTGGFVTSRFKFPPMKCVKFVSILMLLCSCITAASLVLGCDQPRIDMGMRSRSVSVTSRSQMCQSSCQCDDRGDSYGHCSCIAMPSNTQDHVLEAKPGLCVQNCNMMYLYIITIFFSAFLEAMTAMPTFMPIVRSVAENDKGLAIGLNIFSLTLLGTFPGSLVFGRIVDTTCLLWSSGCASTGSCTLYDLQAFRVRLHAMFLSTRVLGLICFVIAFVVASRQRRPFFGHCDADTELDDDEQILNTSIETNLE